MPGRDGTGPIGRGPITGRGFGFCNTGPVGYGCGWGRGFGRNRGFEGNYPIGETVVKTQKEFLEEQKAILENRLQVISQQLEDL